MDAFLTIPCSVSCSFTSGTEQARSRVVAQTRFQFVVIRWLVGVSKVGIVLVQAGVSRRQGGVYNVDPTLLDFSGDTDGGEDTDGDPAAKEAALHGAFPSASDLEHGTASVASPHSRCRLPKPSARIGELMSAGPAKSSTWPAWHLSSRGWRGSGNWRPHAHLTIQAFKGSKSSMGMSFAHEVVRCLNLSSLGFINTMLAYLVPCQPHRSTRRRSIMLSIMSRHPGMEKAVDSATVMVQSAKSRMQSDGDGSGGDAYAGRRDSGKGGGSGWWASLGDFLWWEDREAYIVYALVGIFGGDCTSLSRPGHGGSAEHGCMT